jgi:hypothetical protein
MAVDTNAQFAETAVRIARGEVSPGVAAGRRLAEFSLPADRRGIRKFNDAFARFRSEIQDAAVLCGAGPAQLMLHFLGIMGEHVPTHRQFDEAIRRQHSGDHQQ